MTMSGYYYSAKSGDTWDSVALACYQSENFAAELLCANPELDGKSVFSGGERIQLPLVDAGEAAARRTQSAAPWKE